MSAVLGQNFLKSKAIAKIIASAVRVPKDAKILEVGAGKGILTEELLSLGEVIAVEKDKNLAALLKEKYDNLTVIEKDIRNFNLPKEKYIVIANIPFYITGVIIRKFLEAENKPTSMTLLVQKEVAERIAKDKKESLLSLSVKFYGNPKYIKTVKKNYFLPVPKVDSAIITITDIKERDKNETEIYFSLIKQAFANKRKKLLNNLTKKDRELFLKFAEKNKINKNIRAEDLDYKLWEKFANFRRENYLH